MPVAQVAQVQQSATRHDLGQRGHRLRTRPHGLLLVLMDMEAILKTLHHIELDLPIEQVELTD